nr:uncharacterized protein LOC123759530 [Procambarus clarkii]
MAAGVLVKTCLLGALALLSTDTVVADTNPCAETGMTPYDYSQALCMSFVFYEAQRSGPLPDDNRVPWRGDSALDDGSDVGQDLTGGYYDAGDFVKFGFPMAFTTTMLSWGLIEFPDGYSTAGQTEYAQAAIKWATDYFLKCYNSTDEFWGQVGNGHIDHSYWGRPEEMTMERPSYKIDEDNPGSELAAETAAALAAASIVFKDLDSEYAAQLLDVAEELFDFANNFRENYDVSITDAADFYHSWSGYEDELIWAALWLAKATEEQTYITHAAELYYEFAFQYSAARQFSWDDKKAGVYALYWQLDDYDVALNQLNTYLDWLKNTATYTPEGLVYLDEWGPNRHAANVAFLHLWAAKYGVDTDVNNDWAAEQIDLLLGDNSRYNMSFVVGFGEKYPERPHHASSSCPEPPEVCDFGWAYSQTGPNPHVLYGALVGGPAEDGEYVDDRQDSQQNQVACDFNAAYSGALAALVELSTPQTTTIMAAGVLVKTCLLGALALLSTDAAIADTNPCAETGMTPYDYSQALCMSFVFYEAQRSGPLPDDNRVPWRGDSALDDGSDVGHDLTGGYYDAGDLVKFGFPMAFTTTMLSWGLIEFPDGYSTAGQTEYVLTAIRWATDYFLKCHTATDEFYGQVGNGEIDHSLWGAPEYMTMERPSYKIDEQNPGTDLASETAAALAASFIVFKDVDPEYATQLLDVAKELYEFADNFRLTYDQSITDAYNWYRSWSGYGDELCWAGLWLARATGDDSYLTRVKGHWDEFDLESSAAFQFSWDDKKAGVYALFWLLDGSQDYLNHLNTYLVWLRDSAPYTPEGLVALADWGSNRYAANAAFLSLWAAKEGVDTEVNQEWARGQMGQLLGDNTRYNMSFVVGFGDKYPERPHHRSSSCPEPPEVCDFGWAYTQTGPNPHVLYGALVGGPLKTGEYQDVRQNYQQNEVGCDYNAAYSGALAALVQLS